MTHGPKNDRQPLLRVVVLVLFLAVPGAMLFSGLAMLEERQAGQLKTRLQREQSLLLERFAPLADPGQYLGKLLKETFAHVHSAPEPFSALSQRISRLKAIFPGTFTFVTWDEQTRLVPSCTDIQGFTTILGKVGLVLREIAANVDNLSAKELPLLPEVARHLGLIQGFLGRFFVPGHLGIPYRTDGGFPLIQGDFATDRTYFWHRFGPRLGLLVFISENGADKHHGLEKSIAAFNRKRAGSWQLALIDPRAPERFLATQPGPHAREVLTALHQKTNRGDDLGETEHLIVGSCLLPDGRRLMAYLPRQGNLPDLPRIILGLFLKIALAYAGILGIWASGLTQAFLKPSIRTELILLFLFASGVPLGFLWMRRGEYLENWRESFIFNTQAEAEKLFKHVDDGLGRFRADLETRLEDEMTATAMLPPEARAPQAVLALLASNTRGLAPDELYLFASGGVFLNVCPGIHLPVARKRSIGEVGEAALNILSTGRVSGTGASRPTALNDTNVFRNILTAILFRCGRLLRFSMGTSHEWVFCHLVRFPDNPHQSLFLIAVWSEQTLSEQFLKQSLADLRQVCPDLLIGAHTGRARGSFLPGHAEAGWQQLIETTRNRGRVYFQDVLSQAGIALVGRNFPEVVYLASIPEARVRQQQNLIWWQMTLGGLAFLALGVAIGGGLAREFLQPLGRIETAALAMRDKVFTFEVVTESRDEFGDLERTFGKMMESLKELEVARIVQESLMPKGWLEKGKIQIFGGSQAVTELGGDYFDFLDSGPDRVTILLGDVAGHGVAAALIMAIAKASVFLEKDSWEHPEELLCEVHALLYSLQGKSRKLMSMQLLCLDTMTGRGRIANAGQTYPFLIRAGQAHMIELPSQPLGAFRVAKPVVTEIELLPGDRLILYSDGFIEARDTQGAMVGYDRCGELLQKQCCPDPRAFFQTFRQAHQQIAPVLDDDATMVIVSFAEPEARKGNA